MKIFTTGITDRGTSRKSNQDSYLIKAACSDRGDYVFTSVCDGLGGLSKGELASAELVRAFSRWFDGWLVKHYHSVDFDGIRNKWREMLWNECERIMEYSGVNAKMGTTFSGILISGAGEYLVGHVGDTRVYRIDLDGSIEQLTQDHTVTGAALLQGTMTMEQARKDPRRHVLTQCIGVTARPAIDFMLGQARYGEIYLTCSDGFRNKLPDEEIASRLSSAFFEEEEGMHSALSGLVETAKARNEKDNITATVAWMIEDTSGDTCSSRSEDTIELGFSVIADDMAINTEEVIRLAG
jgi:serine/threonine protein phosphatase PrpC